MRRKYSYIFFSFILIASLVSCRQSKGTSLEDNPSSIPIIDFVDITEITDGEKIYDDQLNFYVENKTDDCVVFPYDYGVEIYTKDENNWLQIPYLGKYMSETTITLTPYFGEHPTDVIFVLPDYSVLNERPERIRVIMQAKLCNDGVPSDEMVADFIDIELGN